MNNEARVFISWSGERSQRVAEKLRSWLPLLIESPEYWISSRDLTDGRRWAAELSECLEVSRFGILVVTPENSSSPWLLFEAGALSKNIQEGKVLPYLVGMEKKELTGPLSQFQALVANKEDTRRLVESIRSSLPKHPDKAVIDKRFDMLWTELESVLVAAIKLQQLESEGIDSLHAKQNDISDLRGELIEAKTLIRQLVNSLTPTTVKNNYLEPDRDVRDLHLLEGSWFGHQGDSHLYAQIIDGQLYAPYCYGADNELTAEYYNWKKVGVYWFARFRWFKENISGFSFYKYEKPDQLIGLWWYDDDIQAKVSTFEALDGEARSRGKRGVWIKQPDRRTPKWAQDFFKMVKKKRNIA